MAVIHQSHRVEEVEVANRTTETSCLVPPNYLREINGERSSVICLHIGQVLIVLAKKYLKQAIKLTLYIVNN